MSLQESSSFLRSPTFLVGNAQQAQLLDEFHRHEQVLSEQYLKNKPLSFHGQAFQRQHPAKRDSTDADVTLAAPMLVGVADGVSQIEDFGIDPSELPRELLQAVEELAIDQLVPGHEGHDVYRGPIPLMREAFESTEALGSTTVLLAVLDNQTQIHGKLHPMIAVISVGDCEIMILRRVQSKQGPYEMVFHTEMQRIDGHAQTPLQVARVDDRVDPEFEEGMTIDVIERGSAVHCISAYEGDLVVLGSDGVFDNLFRDEILDIANSHLPPPQAGRFQAASQDILYRIAKRVVEECHKKTERQLGGAFAETPIGRGGKKDDTSCVVAEVVEWTEEHGDHCAQKRRTRQIQKIQNFFFCGVGSNRARCGSDDESSDE